LYGGVIEEHFLNDVLLPGVTFDASAHMFEEFSLSSGNAELLRLRYVPDYEVEKHGGITHRCEYDTRHWTLEFYRTPYLQRESYRVLCEGNLVAVTDIFRLLHTGQIIFADQTTLQQHVGLLGRIEIKDAKNKLIMHASTGSGILLATGKICVDQELKLDHALPLLIILTHLTTHQQR
jgi:hypothetical protein